MITVRIGSCASGSFARLVTPEKTFLWSFTSYQGHLYTGHWQFQSSSHANPSQTTGTAQAAGTAEAEQAGLGSLPRRRSLP